MSTIDRRLQSALRAQLRAREAALRGGATNVGWKVGAGERERIGGMVVGHLTSVTRLQPGDRYQAPEGEATHADAEVAVLIGSDGAIAGYGAALELCDLSWPDDPEEIVAHNIWHRAFTLGPFSPALGATTGRLMIGDDEAAAAPLPADLPERIERVAEVLGAVGERLRPADVVITGSVVQVPVSPGQAVRADFPGLGQAHLLIDGAGPRS
jgi:hypothetical protein